MYPDGGFGRLRVYGHAIPPTLESTSQVQSELPSEELSSALLGGLALGASDQHFTPCSNLLLPGRGKDMGDGWETARSRTPGHVDWVTVKLGLAGSASRIIVDTKDFRGNFPRAVRVHGLLVGSVGSDEVPAHDHADWKELIKGDKPC
ncbi:allantoicase [Aspergillus puulaauensis]|uniref:Allantoicase n=1 Tax=Aspergillus puulaauensis TaxID=1220207 RepID=A0A7R7XIX8_9EURO|nr:allantoicase [Aspergillus puulaauensis]BCS22185.1 allantoicase [Aspergillus puulaauensis]